MTIPAQSLLVLLLAKFLNPSQLSSSLVKSVCARQEFWSVISCRLASKRISASMVSEYCLSSLHHQFPMYCTSSMFEDLQNCSGFVLPCSALRRQKTLRYWRFLDGRCCFHMSYNYDTIESVLHIVPRPFIYEL